MSRTIFVGDVHGCVDELRDLLLACEQSANDRVILVGDLVAKGPASAEVVQLSRQSGFEAVLGNHDHHVVELLNQSAAPGKHSEHAEVAKNLAPADAAWLQALPLYLQLNLQGQPVVAVHAGIVPGLPLSQQPRKHLLNLRSVREDGSPSRRIEGTPWAAAWKGPAHVVFGHDAVRGLQQYPFATGLDTGCVYGHRLTALVFPGPNLVSVPARRAYTAMGKGQ